MVILEPKEKFKLKTYIKYLLVEPWVNPFRPNLRTVVWILIFVSLFFRWNVVLLISLIVGVILYLKSEYKSGKYIYWLRQRDYKKIS